MSMVINTNLDALDALRHLSETGNAFSSSVQKLSSGLRINTAADDAAGLAISNKLDAQVNGLNQAQRNAQDGVSMVQTAEGALNEIQSMLQRIRELAVEAANGTIGTSDATSINNEVTALQSEITRIAGTTKFNGQSLLTGALTVSQSGGSVNAGYVVNSTSNTSVTSVDVSGAKASTTYTLTANGSNLTLSDGNGNQQTVTVQNIAAKGSETLNFGNLGLSFTVASVAGETAANVAAGLTTGTVTTGAGTGNANFQVGANAGDQIGVTFGSATSSALGLDTAITAFTNALGNWSTNGATAAGGLITATDTAITNLNGIEAGFGAVENRLNHTIAAVGVASENLNASESRIKDLNVASEMVNFTKEQILQQAGTAILAQANSAPQNVLTLLR